MILSNEEVEKIIEVLNNYMFDESGFKNNEDVIDLITFIELKKEEQNGKAVKSIR